MHRLILLASLALTFAFGQTPPAAPKSAFDKKALESYVRHLFVLAPQIAVTVGDPGPSDLPGFSKVMVRGTAGAASKDWEFLISKDGQKMLQGAVYDVAKNPFKPEIDKLKTEGQPSYGTPGAPVVIVEFSDFQCSFCKQQAKTLHDNLLKAYPKEIRMYYMDFPLESMHPWARAASIAGRCVFRENATAFWDYHDWIFEQQAQITEANLKDKVLEFAKSKNLDTLQIGRCMDSKATSADVDKTIAMGKNVVVDSTPTLFVNGRRLPGAIEWQNLKSIIDYEIEYQKTAKNAGEDCGCEIKLTSPVLK